MTDNYGFRKVKNGIYGLHHFIHIPILELRTPHAIHVVFHRKVVFHGTCRTVTALDLVYTAETVAHHAEYAFLVVLRAFRVRRTCRARAFIQECLDFFSLIGRRQVLEILHCLVEFIHTTSPYV